MSMTGTGCTCLAKSLSIGHDKKPKQSRIICKVSVIIDVLVVRSLKPDVSE